MYYCITVFSVVVPSPKRKKINCHIFKRIFKDTIAEVPYKNKQHTTNNYNTQQLDTQEMMTNLPSSFDRTLDTDEMSFWERMKFHCKRQPLVPIGAILTTGALVLAAQNLRKGNQVRAQSFFRWRVGLQSFTLLALVAGSFFYGSNKIQQTGNDEKLREKAKVRERMWLRELERRDQLMLEKKARVEQNKVKDEEMADRLQKEIADLESKISKAKGGE